MSRPDVVRRLTPQQAAVVCSEIIELAHRLDREFFFGNQDPEEGAEPELPAKTRLFLERMREAIARIGWLAEQVSPGTVHKDPRKWLLPPIFFSYGEKGGAA